MGMVKLQSKDEPTTAFYFKTMQDCAAFIYVFKDHWCNVEWNEPIERPDFFEMSRYQREVLNKDPKERAESNLSWGFNLDRKFNRGLNDNQNAFVSAMVGRMTV